MHDLKQKCISVFTDLVLQAPIRTRCEDIRWITWSSYGSRTLQVEDKIVVSSHTVGACSELGLLLEALALPRATVGLVFWAPDTGLGSLWLGARSSAHLFLDVGFAFAVPSLAYGCHNCGEDPDELLSPLQ